MVLNLFEIGHVRTYLSLGTTVKLKKRQSDLKIFPELKKEAQAVLRCSGEVKGGQHACGPSGTIVLTSLQRSVVLIRELKDHLLSPI